MNATEKQIESVALMMAAAYWRGRLQGAGITVEESPGRKPTVEVMIQAAAEADMDGWKTAARLAVS